jgi:hypothetical protein
MEKNKLLSAEEFWANKTKLKSFSVTEAFKEFTRLHCEEQLKAILENVEQEIACDGESTEHFNLSIKPSIINAYPLNQIK